MDNPDQNHKERKTNQLLYKTGRYPPSDISRD